MALNPVELQKALKGVDYPADKRELLDHLQDEDLRSELQKLPDKSYEGPAEVSEELSKATAATQGSAVNSGDEAYDYDE